MRMRLSFKDTGVISVFRYVLAVDLHHRNHTKTKKKRLPSLAAFSFCIKRE